MGLAPKTATIIREGNEIVIPIDEVVVGDIILVKPGEKLSLIHIWKIISKRSYN